MRKKLAAICVGFACSGGMLAQEAVDGGKGKGRAMGKAEYAEAAKARWEELKKQFETRERTKDPFGLALDPALVKEEAVPIEEVLEVKMEEEEVPVKVVSLQDAVDKFQVNGVNAAKQMVMVGFRSLRRGDPVEIEHEGEVFKLRIVKITVDEVVFMDTKTEETASVRLGVVKGIKGAGRKGGAAIRDSMVKPGSTFQVK